jgi:hypothetical protein
MKEQSNWFGFLASNIEQILSAESMSAQVDLANLEGVGVYTAWVKNSSKVPYAASPHKSVKSKRLQQSRGHILVILVTAYPQEGDNRLETEAMSC